MEADLGDFIPGSPLPASFYRLPALEAAPLLVGQVLARRTSKATSIVVLSRRKAMAVWRTRAAMLMADAVRREPKSCSAKAARLISI
ncbi:hypothetical protein [Paenibacillus sanguinis]|uniref:hypothetical protein n=1 Tax=Paenibacillus sanguinis TaxID=225906 RepID=UPI001F0AC117|nr:hypothetical protein [Paenibacillus sanguinis]